MKMRRSVSAWVGVLLLVAIAGLLAAFIWLFANDSTEADRLAAVGAVLGGLIGAGGAALAVYLTLNAQREDEAAKVEASLRAEVVEFARLARGPLDVLTKFVLAGKMPMLARDAPALVALPDPVIFKAVADRLSRLPYGPLLVTFHVRIAEAKQIANIYSLSVPRDLADQGAPIYLTRENAMTLATAWQDICSIARTILRKEPGIPQLIQAGLHQTLADLETSLSHASAVLGGAVTPDRPAA